jgi:hypothetical protein
LALYPHRLNSVLGAARAARAAGEAAAAGAYYKEVLELAGEGSRTAAVQEAERFLERRA